MTSNKGYTAIIISCLMIMFMIIPNVSAFGETKSFIPDSKYGTIELWNNYKIPFISSKIAEYTLTSTSESIIDLSMAGTARLYSDGTLFDDITFKKAGGSSTNIREGSYYIQIIKDNYIDVPDTYKEVCHDSKVNETNKESIKTCNQEVATYKKVNQPINVWEQYKGEILKSGDYTWMWKGKRVINQIVDVQPIKSGETFDEWVWYNSTFSRKVQITNVTSQIQHFNVTYDADMQTDFDDIRFTDSAETYELNYSIRQKVDSASAIFTVEVNGLTSIYMYYGNNAVTTTGNMSAIYLSPKYIYLLDGNSNEFNGLVNGTDTSMTYNSSGKWYGAANFGGSSKIQINGAAETLQNTNQWTILGWTLSTAGANSRTLFGAMKDDTWSSGDGVLAMKTQATNNQIMHYCAIHPSEYCTASGTTLSASTWNYVANERNATAFASYVNSIMSHQTADTRDYGTMGSADLGFSSDGEKMVGQWSDFMIFNRALANTEMAYIGNQTRNGVIFGAEESVYSITVINSIPMNNSNISTSSITFGCNATGTGTNITSVVLNVAGASTWTQTISGLNQASYNATFINSTLVDGSYLWNCSVIGDLTNGSSVKWNFTKDTTAPTMAILSPLNQTYNNINISELNYSYSDIHSDSCWYSKDGGLTNSTKVAAKTNFTGMSVVEGSNTWKLYCNDSFANVANVSVTFNIVTSSSPIILAPTNNQVFNMPPANFTLNYSTGSDPYIQACWYSYNGGANVIMTACANASITINNISSNNLILYVNDSLGIVNSTSVSFKAYPTLIFCNDTANKIAINFTFKDESTDAKMNASLDASTWQYYPTGDSSLVYRTLLFLNLTANDEYTFCIFPNWSKISANINFQYSNSEATVYPQRQWQQTAFALTNTTDLETLYLLPSTAGQYVTFQVINPTLQPLSDVSIVASRVIGGVPTIIENKVTDASGSATLWLSPLYPHSIVASKTGYLTSTNTITPSQTSYTLTLSQTGSSNVTDITNGVTYSILPADSTISPNTNYAFTFTIASPILTLTNYWFNITNASGYSFATASSTGSGSITSNLNTVNNVSLIMDVYYNVSGTLVHTSKYWIITNLSRGDWSINNFVTDLNTYTASGMFGLDSFGIAIIIFLFIFISSGIMAYNFGLYSPTAVAGIITAETAFFDAGLHLIVYPFGVTLPFATIFFGLIFVALAIKEGTSY